MPNTNYALLPSVLLLALSLPAVGQIPSQQWNGEAQQPPPNLETVLNRMQQAANANRERSRAYTITREFRTYAGDKDTPNSQVVAEVNFLPSGQKTYRIVESQGSDRARGVVQKILDDETSSKDVGSARTAITPENYRFSYLGERTLDGRSCYLLRLEPLRKERGLVKGAAWVDEQSYLVRRVEGEMAKTPSWWLKHVHLTMDFGDRGGQWLLTDSKAVADVRLFGTHVLTARTLDYRASTTLAQNQIPAASASTRHQAKNNAHKVARNRPFRRGEAVIGAGVLIEH